MPRFETTVYTAIIIAEVKLFQPFKPIQPLSLGKSSVCTAIFIVAVKIFQPFKSNFTILENSFPVDLLTTNARNQI
jgi:hypothetical protein